MRKFLFSFVLFLCLGLQVLLAKSPQDLKAEFQEYLQKKNLNSGNIEQLYHKNFACVRRLDLLLLHPSMSLFDFKTQRFAMGPYAALLLEESNFERLKLSGLKGEQISLDADRELEEYARIKATRWTTPKESQEKLQEIQEEIERHIQTVQKRKGFQILFSENSFLQAQAHPRVCLSKNLSDISSEVFEEILNNHSGLNQEQRTELLKTFSY